MPQTTDPRHLYQVLVLAAHAIRTHADLRARTVAGITAAQAGLLFAVAERDDPSQREVARMLGVREPAVTGMVQRSVDAGLIERERSIDDPRAWHVSLTTAGRAAIDRISPALNETNAVLLDGFSEDELDIVQRFLVSVAVRFASSAP